MRVVRKTISNVGYIMRQMYLHNRSYYIYWMCNVVLGILSTWISVAFLKLVIELLSEKQFYNAIIFSVVFPAVMFAVGTIGDMVSAKKCIIENSLCNRMKAAVSEKQMEIPYDKADDHAEKLKYDFAKKSVTKSSPGQVLDCMGNIVSNVINAAGVIFVFSNLNIWIILLLIVVVCVNSVGNVKRMQYRYQQQEEETSIARNLYYARDYLTGPVFAKEVRTFDLKEYITAKIKTSIEKHFRLELKNSKMYYRHYWWTYIVNGIQLVAVYSYIGYLLFAGHISVSDFTVYVSSVLIFEAAVLGNITAVANVVQVSRYIRNLREFLQSEETDDTYAVLPDFTKDGLTFTLENVSFRFDDNGPFVLKNLSAKICSGEKICIVGRNGAGKTTFVKLLMGLYRPTEGKIKLNGTDIQEFNRQEYLSLFSTVFQDFNIFAFSIAENVALEETYDEAGVNAAITKAGLQNKVSALPDGIATYLTERIGENGTNLSGGEQQMLAIARAVYKNAPVCILDEPTAALSPQNEYAIYQKFSEITENKTVLYISHRLASCRLSDKIIVLDNGRIVECGSHDHLISLNGKYAEMFSLQAEHYVIKEETGR